MTCCRIFSPRQAVNAERGWGGHASSRTRLTVCIKARISVSRSASPSHGGEFLFATGQYRRFLAGRGTLIGYCPPPVFLFHDRPRMRLPSFSGKSMPSSCNAGLVSKRAVDSFRSDGIWSKIRRAFADKLAYYSFSTFLSPFPQSASSLYMSPL